ncbi:MAG: pitrilysin family protein, partial [Gemmatimonadaceae bacterium]
MNRAVFIRFLVPLCAFSFATPIAAQQSASPLPPPPPLTEKLKIGPEFTVGTLPNGVRYYIRKTSVPAKRMELRLVVNAGSTQEDPDQLGYAHIIEHMAFNGSTHFQKNDLIKYLQSIGVRFGADLNAYTSFDETVYQLSVPTDTARLMEQSFTVLEDWAHGLQLDSAAIVGERGVVLEEWRTALGAGERMQRVAIPIILKDSKYATRLPIGTEESIRTASPAALRRFYKDWYRPDLMAVVAVGDFDVKNIEALIKLHFAGIPRAVNPRARTVTTVPNNSAPLIAITSDAEATNSSFTIGYKHPKKVVATVGDFRTQIVERLYFSMLNSRLNEISQKSDAPFLGAAVENSGFFARGVNAFSFNAAVKDGGIERGAEAVMTEARRVEQSGFLPSELQRTKDNALRSYERLYTEREKQPAASRVGELVRNYLEQEDIPGIEAEYTMYRQFLPGIT